MTDEKAEMLLAPQADNSTSVRISAVRTDYGVAAIPDDAKWIGGWSSSGLPIQYADGRNDVVPFIPDPWEWFGEHT